MLMVQKKNSECGGFYSRKIQAHLFKQANTRSKLLVVCTPHILTKVTQICPFPIQKKCILWMFMNKASTLSFGWVSNMPASHSELPGCQYNHKMMGVSPNIFCLALRRHTMQACLHFIWAWILCGDRRMLVRLIAYKRK